MDPLKMNIEEVLAKWEKHHPAPDIISKKTEPWFQTPLEESTFKRRKRRMRFQQNGNQQVSFTSML